MEDIIVQIVRPTLETLITMKIYEALSIFALPSFIAGVLVTLKFVSAVKHA